MRILQVLLTGSIVAALVYLGTLATISVVAALRAGGRREDGPDSHDPIAASRLTMPVSIVVPAGAFPKLADTVAALLDLVYPELEVIVVADKDVTPLQDLTARWHLESREFFYRRTLDTAAPRRILRSMSEPRLIVIEQEARRYADTLNCGFNFARYRFVAVVPPGIAFDRTALLAAMTPALRDPVSVVGVGSPVEHVPDTASPDRDGSLQWLRSIRSLMIARLFWSHLRRGLGAHGGVTLWRRDAVVQANGFADVTDPELDMMFRLQRRGEDERRFVSNEDPFGRVQGVPSSTHSEAGARQRSALQVIASWGPAAGHSVGWRAFGYFLDAEIVTPLAQAWLVVATTIGAAAGWFSWSAPLASVVLLSFGTAAVSAAALLVRGAHANAPEAAVVQRMLALAPAEFALNRPFRAWARLSALLGRA
jgi:hypothetical protein